MATDPHIHTSQYQIEYGYNSLGNITSKTLLNGKAPDGTSGFGEYEYIGQSHRLKTAGNIKYEYDANGNVIKKVETKDGTSTITNITYAIHNKPTKIEDGTNKTEFFYGPNRARYKKILNNDTTYYVGKHYEQENQSTTKLEKNYIYVGDDLVAIHIEEDDGVMTLPQNRYMHKDALGSIDTITNESGVVIQRLAYDAFGKKLVLDWQNEGKTDKPLVKRGYTGHEHIEEFGFIHMNGRVYDPSTGRFLSADPNIPYPLITQSFNRYSYVRNNPLVYVDPSGYIDDYSGDGSWGGDDPGNGRQDNSSHENGSPSNNSSGDDEPESSRQFPEEKEKSWYEKSVEAAKQRYYQTVYRMFGVDISPPEEVSVDRRGTPQYPFEYEINTVINGYVNFTSYATPYDLLVTSALDAIERVKKQEALAQAEREFLYSKYGVMTETVLGAMLPGPMGKGKIINATVSTKPSLSAVKATLKEVHKIVGKQPKGKIGKFGSPQAGTSKKGYRLDPPHPNAPKGSAETGYHFNYWDYTKGKKGKGGINDALKIGK